MTFIVDFPLYFSGFICLLVFIVSNGVVITDEYAPESPPAIIFEIKRLF